MIILAHGAFDSKADRNNGVATLTDRIRELKVSNHIHEIDVNEWPVFEPAELLAEPNIYIGYSNGGDQVWTKYLAMLAQTEDQEVTSVQAHFIFLDFVWRGVRQVFDRAPINLPTSVKSCLCFYRTVMAGPLPPYHNLIARQDGALFQNLPVEADHGRLPSAPDVQDAVCRRILEVFH